MVAVGVGENDPAEFPGAAAEVPDRERDRVARADWAGVDQAQAVRVLPEIGLSDLETQQVQVRREFEELHDVDTKQLRRTSAGGSSTGRTSGRPLPSEVWR
jgi:serine/threonine protein kinase HipA of HipAB toxin-antitoxin module